MNRLIENKLRKIIQNIIKEEVKLNEAFKSAKLRVFADDLKQLSKTKYNKTYYTKLFNGVAWDKIPDKDIIVSNSKSQSIKSYINNDEYVIIWILLNSDEVIKYRSPGTKRGTFGGKKAYYDRSIKTSKGKLLVTRGRNFLKGASIDLSKAPVASDKYEKPYEGDLSVLKLSAELSADCIIIKHDILLQYSTTDLRKSRINAKLGATAMQKSSDILYKNQERYRQLLSTNKASRKTKQIDDLVAEMLKELKDYMATEVSMGLSKLLSVKPYTIDQYDTNYNREVEKVTMDEKALDRLKTIVQLHADIINQYDSYLYDVRNKSEDRIQQSIEKLNKLKDKIEEL